jgi:hypothetical protein
MSVNPIAAVEPLSIKGVEQSVLGSCMVGPTMVGLIQATLSTPDRFSDERHQVMYAALLELAERGEPTDAQALKDHLEGTGRLDKAGGQFYLLEVFRAGEIPSDPTYQARIVAREAARRRAEVAIDRGQAWMRNPHHRDDMPALLAAIRDEVNQALEEVAGELTVTRPGGWGKVDLTELLNGSYQPPMPTVGAREDGVGLFYPGRGHSIAAESEAGKSWLALAAVLCEIERGNAAVYLDFEDDAAGIVGRLLAMGAKPDAVRDRFGYIRPDHPLTSAGGRAELAAALGDLRPSLVVLDGVTEAMTLHGFDPLNNKDAASFGRLLIRPATATGAAVVTLDHVAKDREGRGRYAIGAVHKLNGIDGAMYSLENREPFGVGRTGRSGLYIAKDRPGQLRRRSVPSSGDRQWFGDLVVTGHDATFAEVAITPPPAGDGRADRFRPTHLMRRVSEALERAGRPLNKGDVEDRVTGKAEHIRAAIACLVDEGNVRLDRQGNARMHVLVRPFTDE